MVMLMNVIQVVFAMVLILGLTACSKKTAVPENRAEETPPAYAGISKEEGVIDLDAMPDSIRYANAYALVLAPEDYVGRRLRVRAPIMEIMVGHPKKKTLAFSIYDAARCCLVTIPFEFDRNVPVPGDVVGKTMTITGTITVFKGEMGFYLADSQITP
jgi:hypothetical protein